MRVTPCVAVLFFVSFLAGRLFGAAPTPTKDSILIVGLTPATLVDGIETEVEVTVAYELLSQAGGLVEISANTLRPQSSAPFGSTRIAQGAGTVQLKGKVTPRFWNSTIPFKVSAFLVTVDATLARRTVVSTDHKKVIVALRPNAPESYAVNPNPRDVYEDGLKIVSISPDTFAAGVPVTVEVKVSYDLRSREQGEINLGSSNGLGNGYTIIGRTQVKMGAGETSITARIVPRRTGSLPFTKVFVNLSEYPHRSRWSPLATDSETVEVR